MLIAVPSKGRAGSTTTQNILPEATFYVPSSEYHQYKDIYKNVVSVPKEVNGITKTRNWILKNTDNKRVVMIDDDVKNCGYTQILETKSNKVQIKNTNFWLNEFMLYFDLCEQLNYKIWGIRTESSLRGTYPYKPFLFRTYVTASCMGIINDGEYDFDESFPVKEDYEISLRHVKEKGGILGIRYLHWENSHWEDDGGCKDYRTLDMEKTAIRQLIEMYPGIIRSVKRTANEFTIYVF